MIINYYLHVQVTKKQMSTPEINIPFAYTVTCELPDEDVAAEWVAWLTGGHMQQLIDTGASSASLIQLEPLKYEVRYLYPSRLAFEQYEKEHAPSLRAEGLQKFPASLGLVYRRSTGSQIYFNEKEKL